jgi:hypothetical protein
VRPLVLAAVEVREMHAARASYDARLPNLVSRRMAEEDALPVYVDSGRYRGLVRFCGVMRWAAGLLYAARGDEEAGGGPCERHIAPEELVVELRWNIRYNLQQSMHIVFLHRVNHRVHNFSSLFTSICMDIYY